MPRRDQLRLMSNHLLYSYRRCPYAMRARMALISAQIQCDVHDVDLKSKPAHMLEISPKGTVPALLTKEGRVIEESLDIVYWALSQDDPENLLQKGAEDLISENDGPFKSALDRYKYPNRFPDEDCSDARDNAEDFLRKLNNILKDQTYLMASSISVADICIFPFIRQCANVNREWFDGLPYKNLQKWLQFNVESELFKQTFKKQKENQYILI